MSADEDNELRDLVAQTLESNGVLSKIRAQLRASVFLALEEQSLKENKPALINKELQDFLNSDDGRIVASLIREFLDYFNLVFTQSVFSPETGESVQYNYDDRQQLCNQLNLNNANGPILVEVLRKLRSSKDESVINLTLAKEQFSNHDKDKNGKIDKETTCDVFMDLFPNFRRSLVEKFVSEEFQEIGKNFNEEISFDEFKTFYQKLFDLCQSVVNHDTSFFVSSTNKINTFTKSDKFQNSEDLSGDHFSVKTDFPSQTAVNVSKLEGDDVNGDHDPFFDDAPSPTFSTPSSHKEKPAGNGGKTLFMDSLPALVTTTRGENQDGGRDSPLLSKLDQDINAKLAEIGLIANNDDYDDDDFQSSGQKSGSEASIDEEIEGDTSAYADLLCSTASGVSLAGNENITTDKTVSQMSISGIDYLESLHHDSGDKV